MEQLALFANEPLDITGLKKMDLSEYQSLVDDLKRSFEKHAHLLAHGGADPFWPDGCNLNLIRNHIIYDKNRLKRFNEIYFITLPDIYYRDTPEEVDPEYQAPGSRSGKYYTFRNQFKA